LAYRILHSSELKQKENLNSSLGERTHV
jgi:hypothetical protein